jgi:hypothetical protein
VGVACCVTAAVLVLATSPLAAGAASKPGRSVPQGTHGPSLRFATSGDHSEIRERLPVADHKWGKKRVAMTIAPAQLPALHKGDVLTTTGEVQLSNTCAASVAATCSARARTLGS